MSDREPFEAARRAGKALHQEQRLAVAMIKRALEALPATCRYHGENIEQDYGLHGVGSCCDTGKPAMYRKYAEDALRRLARD